MTDKKRPIIINAIQLNWKNWEKLCDWIPEIINDSNPARMVKDYSETCGEEGDYIELTIPTLGDRVAKHGDYIIKGIAGEIYPCKPYIFRKTYEKEGEDDKRK